MNVNKFVKDILQQSLHLDKQTSNLFEASTPLLGNLPELDSIGVVSIITMLEDQLGCSIDDDEINADIFETFGSLMSFVENKL